MGNYSATIQWSRGDSSFVNNEYSRAHEWHFDGGVIVPASASPQIVPEPWSVAANVDPEEAFVAALSSCHMLFFLSLAAAHGVTVDKYSDAATGTMKKDSAGRTAITDVLLKPTAFYYGTAPDRLEIETLHDKAHHSCFIANSVSTMIRIDVIS